MQLDLEKYNHKEVKSSRFNQAASSHSFSQMAGFNTYPVGPLRHGPPLQYRPLRLNHRAYALASSIVGIQ